MSTQSLHPINPDLTSIAIAYSNSNLVADLVLPRVGVGSPDFKYLTYNKNDRYTLPETQVGRTGKVNEIEFGATEASSSVKDYGLEDPVPQADIDNAPVNYDPLGNAVEGIMDLVLLGREKRVADMVFAAANYDTGLKQTLSGTDQWSDFTNSDPIGDILENADLAIQRPNKLVIGREVFTQLRQHPSIVKATHGNSGDKGIIAMQALGELFEMDVIVGSPWLNTANPGQTASFSRVWGKHAAMLYIDPTANTRRGVTFGLTAQYGDRVSKSWHDENIGLNGGTRVKTGESVKELIVASDVGYLFTNAIA